MTDKKLHLALLFGGDSSEHDVSKRSAHNIYEAVDKNKYDVSLFLITRDGIILSNEDSLRVFDGEEETEVVNEVVPKMDLSNPLEPIINLNKEKNIDVFFPIIHGNLGEDGTIQGLLRLLQKPYVGSGSLASGMAYDKDINKIKEFFDGIKINEYNHVVFVSNESKKDLCKIYKTIESKSVTINNLIDYERILKLSNKKIEIKRTNKKIFLFVGRLDESSKRLTLLLRVANKCKQDKVKAIFWIIGSGPDEKKYKDIVNKDKLDNVIFMGAKKNPYPYMKACDYLILTSRYEGFPVVYNEAIILDKPIITTIDVSDDYVSIPNRFGYVVDENNIYEKVKSLSEKKEKLKEKVDYDALNKKRMKLIEDLMEMK